MCINLLCYISSRYIYIYISLPEPVFVNRFINAKYSSFHNELKKDIDCYHKKIDISDRHATYVATIVTRMGNADYATKITELSKPICNAIQNGRMSTLFRF